MDLVMIGEPYQGLVMLININASEYILRVLGSTRYRNMKLIIIFIILFIIMLYKYQVNPSIFIILLIIFL